MRDHDVKGQASGSHRYVQQPRGLVRDVHLLDADTRRSAIVGWPLGRNVDLVPVASAWRRRTSRYNVVSDHEDLRLRASQRIAGKG